MRGNPARDLGVSARDSHRRIRGSGPVDGAGRAIGVKHRRRVPTPTGSGIAGAKGPIAVWSRRPREFKPLKRVHVESPHRVRRVLDATRGDERVGAVDVESPVNQDLIVVPHPRGAESRGHPGDGDGWVNLSHGDAGIGPRRVRNRNPPNGVRLQRLVDAAAVMVRVRHDERADEVTGRDEALILDGDGEGDVKVVEPIRRRRCLIFNRVVHGERRAGGGVDSRRSAEHAHVSIRHGHDGRSGPALVTVALVVRNPRIDRLPLKRGPPDHLRRDLELKALTRVVPRGLVAVPRAVRARPEHGHHVPSRGHRLVGLEVKPRHVVVVVPLVVAPDVRVRPDSQRQPVRQRPGGARILHHPVPVRLRGSQRRPDRPAVPRPLVVRLRVNERPPLRQSRRVVPREGFELVDVVVVAEDDLQVRPVTRAAARVGVHVERERLEEHVRVAIKVLVPGVCGFAVPQRRVDVGLGVERRADARREEGVEANVVGARALARDGARRRRRNEILAHGGDRGEVGGPEVLRPGVQDAVPNGAKAVGLVALSVGIVVGRLGVPEHEVVLSARDVDGELDLFVRGGAENWGGIGVFRWAHSSDGAL